MTLSFYERCLLAWDWLMARLLSRLRPSSEKYQIARLRSLGVEVGKNVRIYGSPIISMESNSRIIIGDGVVLCSKSDFTALGVTRPVILRTLAPNAIIQIGSQSGLSGTVVCAAQSVSIGEDCLVGSGVVIVDTDFHSLQSLGRRHNKTGVLINPVVIENNVFLGMGTIVLRGVNIGHGSVIGAGSIVTQSIPPEVVAAGNPARAFRKLP